MSNSRIQIVVFFALMVIILILVGVSALRPSTNGTNSIGVDTNNTVAVLVVDAFEPLAGVTRPNIEDQADKNCIVDPTGQGGWISGAGGWISGAGGWISGAGGWISGAGGWISGASQQPILDPHGRIVYNELEALIRQGGGILQELHIGSTLADTTAPNTDWLRDVGRWDMGVDNGHLMLAGVDTDQYTSDVIAGRIEESVRLLNRQFGITRFVLNMSFAIIPCDDVLTPGQYQAFLEQESADFQTQLQSALEALAATPDGLPLPSSAAKFLSSDDAQRFRQELREQQLAQFDTCYPLRDDASQDAVAAQTSQPAQPNDARPNGLPLDAICAEVQPENEPLARSIAALESLEVQAGQLSIIPIAASGNRGDIFSFAPGFWPNVVSVSAFYNEPEYCAGFPLPPSNAGEVQMYGMYDCLPGTSFAAPRLSLEAGMYLMRAGTVSCAGQEANSSPPLSYLHGRDAGGNPTFDYLFENLGRVAAATAYCEDFNTLVGVPPTPTP